MSVSDMSVHRRDVERARHELAERSRVEEGLAASGPNPAAEAEVGAPLGHRLHERQRVRAEDLARSEGAPEIAERTGGAAEVERSRGEVGDVEASGRRARERAERKLARARDLRDREQRARLIGAACTSTREHEADEIVIQRFSKVVHATASAWRSTRIAVA